MQIVEIESGPVATKGYLVIDSKSSRAVIIDAPLDSTSYFSSIIDEKNLNIDAILLTHSHWDHTADCNKLSHLTKSPVFVHKADEHRITEPMKHTIFPLPFTIEAVDNFVNINAGDKISVGSLELEVRFTPGHTEGGVCYVEHNSHVVFTGDTLFSSSIGRVDLPGGCMEQLIDSIKTQLMVLPDSFIVYSGHGPATTIGMEKNNNPFLT